MKQALPCDEATQTMETTPADEVEARQEGLPSLTLPSVCVGRLLALSTTSVPLVDFPANALGELLPARSLVAISQANIGEEVALAFEDGDSTRPIILGVLQPLGARSIEDLAASPATTKVEVTRDQESLVLSANKEITLHCGKSSITLTSAGKVLIRGAYLLSRSSGVNRIKGGSVQIN